MMHYEKPELVVVESALALVLGFPLGIQDNGVAGDSETPDLALGLDD
jgi:hypothetical protein